MSGETKLLTEAEAEVLWKAFYSGKSLTAYMADLRERGIMEPAPEPVDALLVEAKALREDWLSDPEAGEVDLALAALRRGMELAQPPLTRDHLGDAIVKVFVEGATGFGRATPNEITALHAALSAQP